jgi:hypothetical protein
LEKQKRKEENEAKIKQEQQVKEDNNQHKIQEEQG